MAAETIQERVQRVLQEEVAILPFTLAGTLSHGKNPQSKVARIHGACKTMRIRGMTHTRVKLIFLLVLLMGKPALSQVTTSQYNNARTAATLSEKVLTPQNVTLKHFGKLGAFKVDGAVFAQPLYIPHVEIPGRGVHNVLYVATEHDSVYAFDADHPGSLPLWQVSFLDKARGAIPLSEDMVQCPFIRPEVGITSTPVIDIKTGTLYVLARTAIRHAVGDNEYFQHLHALAVTTGVEKFGGPKLITASVPGRGAGRSNRQVDFDPLHENPRAALTLANNNLYLTWASSCDVDPYHGWVLAYDPQTLAQKAVLNVNPDGSEAGIWLSDTGPAVDSEGNLYVPTANGTFDATSGGTRLRRFRSQARRLIPRRPRLLYSLRSSRHPRR
jgi:hypothetical protein